jgi:multidrug efflux pump subunit AcrA (membrane-fusion protein)
MGLLLLLTGTAGAGPGEEKVYASHLMVDQEVVVSSRLSGVVETIAVNRGAVVSQGQALAIRTAFRTPEPGEVQFISPTVDAGSGTFQVVIRVRREPARTVLRPGIAVKVRFVKAGAR